MNGGAAEHELEHDAGGAHDQRHDDHEEVLEQHAEGQQHHAKRRQRVESRERRGEESAGGPAQDEQPEHDAAQPVLEQEAQAGTPSSSTNRMAKLLSWNSSIRLPKVLLPSPPSQRWSASLTGSGCAWGRSTASGDPGESGCDGGGMARRTIVGVPLNGRPARVLLRAGAGRAEARDRERCAGLSARP